MIEKMIFSTLNKEEADYVCSILDEQNINNFKRIDGLGDYLAIAAGNTFNKKIQIFVSEEDYIKANDLVKSIINIDEEIKMEDIPEELKDITDKEEKENEEIVNKTKKKFKIIVFFMLFPVFISIIIIIVNTLLMIIKNR